MPEAAELMVRSGIGLKEAVTQLCVPMTSADCEKLLRRKPFQRLLWQARFRVSEEIASSPERSKTATIGKLQQLAQKLEDEGEADKAAAVLFQMARIEGHVGGDSTVNVFADLSQKDLDALKQDIEARRQAAQPAKDAVN